MVWHQWSHCIRLQDFSKYVRYFEKSCNLIRWDHLHQTIFHLKTGATFAILVIRDIKIIMWAQEAAMTALVRLEICCFVHLQGIYIDLVVDIIIIIVSVYFWVQINMLDYSILAYSIIKFLDRRFWIFRICIIKWSIRVPWQSYHWSNLEDGWRNQIFSFQYRLHSTLNYNINYTLINTPSLPASSHTRFGSTCNHGHNSRFVEFFKLTFAGI